MDLKMEWPDDDGLHEYLFNDRETGPDIWKERLYDDDLYFDEELLTLLQLQEKKSNKDGYY